MSTRHGGKGRPLRLSSRTSFDEGRRIVVPRKVRLVRAHSFQSAFDEDNSHRTAFGEPHQTKKGGNSPRQIDFAGSAPSPNALCRERARPTRDCLHSQRQLFAALLGMWPKGLGPNRPSCTVAAQATENVPARRPCAGTRSHGSWMGFRSRSPAPCRSRASSGSARACGSVPKAPQTSSRRRSTPP